MTFWIGKGKYPGGCFQSHAVKMCLFCSLKMENWCYNAPFRNTSKPHNRKNTGTVMLRGMTLNFNIEFCSLDLQGNFVYTNWEIFLVANHLRGINTNRFYFNLKKDMLFL